ncbi:MAG: RNase H-like domain-containing protein [Nitrososphaeraceae archaeon]
MSNNNNSNNKGSKTPSTKQKQTSISNLLAKQSNVNVVQDDNENNNVTVNIQDESKEKDNNISTSQLMSMMLKMFQEQQKHILKIEDLITGKTKTFSKQDNSGIDSDTSSDDDTSVVQTNKAGKSSVLSNFSSNSMSKIKLQLPKFNPDNKQGDTYTVFLGKYEHYCRVNGLEDSDKVLCIIQCLEGRSGPWYANLIQKDPEISDKGWDYFKSLMNNRWLDKAEKQSKDANYINRVYNETDTVKQLADDLDQLAAESGRADISDQARYDRLWLALCNHRIMKAELTKMRHQIHTFAELVAAAHSIESAINLNKQHRERAQGSLGRMHEKDKQKGYKSNDECYYCKRKYHIAKDCYLNPQSAKYKPELANKFNRHNNSNGTSTSNSNSLNNSSMASNNPPNSVGNNSATEGKPNNNTQSDSSGKSQLNNAKGSLNYINNSNSNSKFNRNTFVSGYISRKLIKNMLVDNGCTHSIISKCLWNSINLNHKNKLVQHLITDPTYFPNITMADNHTTVTIIGMIKLPFKLGTTFIGYHTFLIATNLNEDIQVYIGNDILLKFGVSIINENNETMLAVKYNRSSPETILAEAAIIKIPCNKYNKSNSDNYTINNIQNKSLDYTKVELDPKLIGITIGKQLSTIQQGMIKYLLNEYKDCFAGPDDEIAIIKTDIKHRVDTGDHKPIHQRPYRQPPILEEAINKQIDKWLKQGVLVECEGEWSSPVTVVTKKDETYRICGDFRQLNKITKKDVHPTPYIEEQKTRFLGCNIFSGIDLKDAYLGVLINESDQEKVAIITNRGLYKFIRMPFGLTNAPATYLRIIERIFKEYISEQFVSCYFDDINLFSIGFENHYIHLHKVLSKMREHNLKAKPSKCKFAVDELDWMGYVVNAHGISPGERLVGAIQRMQIPTTVTEVRRFLGLCNCFHHFIENYATIAKPLYNLTRKGVNKIIWDDNTNNAFNTLKQKLITYPILKIPDPLNDYVIYCDASDYGIGAVLSQLDRNNNNKEYVVGYWSRTLSKEEIKYGITDKECAALVGALKHFYQYLYNGRKHIIYTDHISLKYLQDIKNMHGKLGRMSLYIQQYDLEIRYNPGIKHTKADVLSRLLTRNVTVINNDLNYDSDKNKNVGTISIIATKQIGDLTDISNAQLKDPVIASLIQYVNTNQQQLPEDDTLRLEIHNILESVNINSDKLIVKDNILYNQRTINDDEIYNRIVIPDNELMKIELLKKIHNEGGHPGEIGTMKKLNKRVWWKSLAQDTRDFVKSCDVCAKSKPTHEPIEIKNTIISQGSTHEKDAQTDLNNQLTKFPQPFTQLVVDHTEMPLLNNGYKHILVIIDRATRWSEAYPCKTLNANEYLKYLFNDWIPRYGVPTSILSDQGGAFNSDNTLDMYRAYNIQAVYSSSHSPQSHGLVERFNRTLKTLLTCMSVYEIDHNNKTMSWLQLLPMAMLYYRSNVNSTTQYSPYQLVFGRECKLPIDNLISNDEIYQSATDYLATHLNKLKAAHDKVKTILQSKQEKNITNNKNNGINPSIIYNIGDYVWVKEVLTKNKLIANWNGPYKIIEDIGNNSYKLKPTFGDRRGRPITVNYRRLKKIKDVSSLLRKLRSAESTVDDILNV